VEEEMKKKVWAAMTAVGMLASTIAHASPVWTPMPGVTGTQIGVGAGDIPFVLRSDGHLFYGRNVLVNVGGINVINWQWVDSGGVGTILAVNLNNEPFLETTSGHFWAFTNPSWQQMPLMRVTDGTLACMNAFVVDVTVVNPQYVFPNTTSHAGSIDKFWGLDCTASPGLWQLNANWHGLVWDSVTWNQIDTGDGHVLALFSTTSGSTVSQTPWIIAFNTAWAWNGSVMVQTVKPWFNSRNITWLSDGYALASNQVWKWNGTIFGSPASTLPWLPTSGVPPTGATLSKIAAAGTLPGINVTSHIWALDTAGNVYRLDDDAGGPPPH
jgi:hypothetical protein